MIRRALLILAALLAPAIAYGVGAPVDLSTDKVAHVQGIISPETDLAFELEMLSDFGSLGDRLILINSPGGQVDSGVRMIGLMEAEKARGVRIVCVVTGEASSMAFNLLTHCDVRLASSHAFMVVHKVAIGMLPPDRRLTAAFLRQVAAYMDELDEPFRQANARAMHLSLKDYDLFADNETAWTAETLLRMGYLDGLVTPTPQRN